VQTKKECGFQRRVAYRVRREETRGHHLDERADIFVLNTALELKEAGGVRTMGGGLVLEVALTTLITDRTIERVVHEEELHDGLASLLDDWGVGVDIHVWHHLKCGERQININSTQIEREKVGST